MGLFQDGGHGPCIMCEWWGGPAPGGSGAIVCDREHRVNSRPSTGCAFWVRCIGLDDSPLPHLAPKLRAEHLEAPDFTASEDDRDD